MFVFIDMYMICKTRYSKMIKNTDMQFFYGVFENEQKKDKTKFDIPKRGVEPQIFSNFPAHDLKVRMTRSNQNKLIKEI